jgi:hypothetical protein
MWRAWSGADFVIVKGGVGWTDRRPLQALVDGYAAIGVEYLLIPRRSQRRRLETRSSRESGAWWARPIPIPFQVNRTCWHKVRCKKRNARTIGSIEDGRYRLLSVHA